MRRILTPFSTRRGERVRTPARAGLAGTAAALLLIATPIAASAQERAGTTANRSGDRLESEIAFTLKTEGFAVLANSEWEQRLLYAQPDVRWAITNAPYDTIYGSRSYIEFLLIDGAREILVEAKRQTSSGSVDEKFPFIYHNALLNIEEHGREFVFVMDGEGSREGARDWIRARAAQTPGFTVLGPDELADWLRASPSCAEREAPQDAPAAPPCATRAAD